MKIFLCYQERLKKNLKESDKKIEENFCLYEAHYWPVKRGFFRPFNYKIPRVTVRKVSSKLMNCFKI